MAKLVRRRKHGRLTAHQHSPKMWKCLQHLEEQGVETGKAHRICYASVGKGFYDALLARKAEISFGRESALINMNKKTTRAQRRHRFVPAQWVQKCLICGEKKRIDGYCLGVSRRF